MSWKRYYNQNWLDTIDEPLKAYFLGFFAADGCLTSGKFQFKITQKDGSHQMLLPILLAFNPEKPLKLITRKKTGNRHWVLAINNKNLYLRMQDLGFTSRKSLTIGALSFVTTLSPLLQRSYFLGYYDGDGSISKAKQSTVISISLTGTFPFLNQLQSLIPKEFRTKIYTSKAWKVYRLRSLGSNLERFALMDWLYKNQPYFMPRKFNKFEALRKEYENPVPYQPSH